LLEVGGTFAPPGRASIASRYLCRHICVLVNHELMLDSGAARSTSKAQGLISAETLDASLLPGQLRACLLEGSDLGGQSRATQQFQAALGRVETQQVRSASDAVALNSLPHTNRSSTQWKSLRLVEEKFLKLGSCDCSFPGTFVVL
jgi:hypothetical protein